MCRANEVSELRNQLNVVAFRSSSAVFADFQRQFESYREFMLQSIDFEMLWDRLKELQNAVKNARRGQRGLNQLSAFHENDA
jgi:hypothetical protein